MLDKQVLDVFPTTRVHHRTIGQPHSPILAVRQDGAKIMDPFSYNKRLDDTFIPHEETLRIETSPSISSGMGGLSEASGGRNTTRVGWRFKHVVGSQCQPKHAAPNGNQTIDACQRRKRKLVDIGYTARTWLNMDASLRSDADATKLVSVKISSGAKIASKFTDRNVLGLQGTGTISVRQRLFTSRI